MIIYWLSLSTIYIISLTLANPTNLTGKHRKTLDDSSSASGRSAISIIEEDKRCFACPIIPDTGIHSRCIVPCHYNQRCYLRASHANATLADRRCTDERWVRDLLVDGCLTYNGQYWCMCSTDLCNSGDFTSIRGYDDCSNEPCPWGTICLDTKDGFSCICPPWQDDCTYAFNIGCSCKNGGRCIMGLGSYICECPYGYNGLSCETRDICIPNPCMNGGTCQSQGLLSFTCQCRPGFQGLTCQICDACIPNPCQNGGTCVFDDATGYFRCTCPPGYTGRTCDIGSTVTVPPSNPCSPNPCKNGGTCQPTNTGSFTCTCPAGYQGVCCEIRSDPCSPNPCRNGGTCQPTNTGSFMCLCPVGYQGICCETRIDPCSPNPCQNNGICTASGTSAVCTCVTGFTGQRCETRDACNPNPCLNGGTCIPNGFGGFTCQCPPGFSGQRCEDQDGCVSQPCKNNGVCVSSGGGAYTCQCPTGFEGQNCDQVDICGVKNPCICGTCQNDPSAPQGFRCFCPPGYSGDRCEKLTSCIDSGEECINGGECIQRPIGDYICSCPFPYCGSRCQNQRPFCDGTNSAVTPTVTTLNPACSSSLCNNRGTCQQNGYGKGIQCYCSAGWSGPRCQYAMRTNADRSQDLILKHNRTISTSTTAHTRRPRT
ncbi:unnamed protein product [Rotaria sp. Silwood1]|nr:unnamed protein product [Rotaria sp. Silwood1]CAF1585357.1 unnamed protein product [Rotaria sp. Silwood1]